MFVSKVTPKTLVLDPFFEKSTARKTILVCGGAGFLGSHLCRMLLLQDHNVVCVDNLLTGRLQNVQDLMSHPNFSFTCHDIIHPLIINETVDQIYNLACAASPPQYQRDPIHTFKTSVIGALNLLDLAKLKKARILQASTSEVYGDPSVSPQPEGYFGNVNTFGPRSCYDEGKRAAETLFHDYNERHGIVTKIARIFNTYGPGMSADDGRVVSNFIVQAIRGEDLSIYGDGSQTRSFCYRDDLVSGLILLMNSPEDVCKPINLGNPGEFTILELAEQILRKIGTRSRLEFRNLPVDDPQQRRPDISTARSVLNWAPTVQLSEGLDRTIAHFREDAVQSVSQIEMIS